jgi:hypothetical protein
MRAILQAVIELLHSRNVSAAVGCYTLALSDSRVGQWNIRKTTGQHGFDLTLGFL